MRHHGYHRSRGWRPVAIRPFYLFFVAALMFLMLLTLEGLRRYSELNGGLIYFKDTASVSYLQSFAYNYVPIIVALALVTLWSFVDFDVLRLEPYFQLSRPEGVPATVLFINYNFGQSIITPITSARRKHWVVLFVSVFTMLMRMSLPALQSTLFELREVTVYADETMRGWPDLIDLQTQGTWMIAQESNSFDSVLSSQDASQRSRSSTYAVAPVEIPRGDQRDSTVWTLNQTIYWAEPSCQNVMVNETVSVTADNSAGEQTTMSWNVSSVPMEKFDGAALRCELDFHYNTSLFPGTDQLQVRYWEPVSSNTTLLPVNMRTKAFTARGCDPFDIYGVLIDVNSSSSANPTSTPPLYTSSANIFACNVAYHKAEAEVSMHANSSITNISVHGGTTSELTPDQFNIPEFQELLSQRAPYTSDLLYIQVNETSGDTTATELPVISQKLGDLEPLLILDASTIMTSDELQSKVEKGVTQAFVLTMGRLFNPDERPSVIHAKRLSNQVAIAAVNFAAFWSEIVLISGTLLTLGLVFIYHRRPNILQSDPGSISAMCSMLADVFSPSNILSNPHFDLHQFSTRQLRRILHKSRIHWQDGPHGNRLEIVPSHDIGKLDRTISNGLGWLLTAIRIAHGKRGRWHSCSRGPNASFPSHPGFHLRISSVDCRDHCHGVNYRITRTEWEIPPPDTVRLEFLASDSIRFTFHGRICCRLSLHLHSPQPQYPRALGPSPERDGLCPIIVVNELFRADSMGSALQDYQRSSHVAGTGILRVCCQYRAHGRCRWPVYAAIDYFLLTDIFTTRELQPVHFLENRFRGRLH